jgi:hypothetical protein
MAISSLRVASLALHLSQILLKAGIRHGHESIIKTPAARLAAADKDNGVTFRVKCEKVPVWISLPRETQLFHIGKF